MATTDEAQVQGEDDPTGNYLEAIDYASPPPPETRALRDALWHSRLDHGDPRHKGSRWRIWQAEKALAALEARLK